MDQDQQQVDAKTEARAAVFEISRDGAYFVLGCLIEAHPESVLKAVRLYQTVLGIR